MSQEAGTPTTAPAAPGPGVGEQGQTQRSAATGHRILPYYILYLDTAYTGLRTLRGVKRREGPF